MILTKISIHFQLTSSQVSEGQQLLTGHLFTQCSHKHPGAFGEGQAVASLPGASQYTDQTYVYYFCI